MMLGPLPYKAAEIGGNGSQPKDLRSDLPFFPNG
jgi:hypothetical protein